MGLRIKSGQRIAYNLCARRKLFAYTSLVCIATKQKSKVDSSNFL